MPLVRLDPHAHLYECYDVRTWVEAAIENLCPKEDVYIGVVIVDRQGQDSFARLRQSVPDFAQWTESVVTSDNSTDSSVVGHIRHENYLLSVIRGVQYVTSERLEVLSLGAPRVLDDGLPICDVIDYLQQHHGITCIPWSPGKWMGKRGGIIRDLLKHYQPGKLVFGDISMRSTVGPPSMFLCSAKQRGFSVLAGTDPLPRPGDVMLVGSYGIEITVDVKPQGDPCLSALFQIASARSSQPQIWGRANGALRAVQRFLTTL